MAAVTQGDPTGSNDGWPTSVTTNAAQENVTFNAYRNYDVDLGTVPGNWSITTNNANVAVAVAGAAGTWTISASSSAGDDDSGGGTPSTTLTISSG